MKEIKRLFIEYKSVIKYIFIGGLTTLVNIVSYILAHDVFNCSTLASNSIAWGLAVLFAFITNKLYVFESKGMNIKEMIFQAVSFFSCRVFSGVIETAIMVIFVDFMNLNSTFCKIITNVIVMVLNYFASKLIIFKK